MVLMGGSNFGRIPIKTERNQDANSITETAVLKLRGSGKIMELYRAVREIPENQVKSN